MEHRGTRYLPSDLKCECNEHRVYLTGHLPWECTECAATSSVADANGPQAQNHRASRRQGTAAHCTAATSRTAPNIT